MSIVWAYLIQAWRWLKANWKAALGGVSVVLVLIYTGLSNRHRKQAVELKRQAHEAAYGKVERIKDARDANRAAIKHGDKATEHQIRAAKVIEKLRAKEGKRMGAAEARELAERIAGKQ